MSKIIKFTITLITSIIFLTACSTTTSNEDSNWNSQPNQESKKQNIALEEKINNKQKYIVIQEYINESTLSNEHDTQRYIEEKSNIMSSKKYELIQQNITFTDYGGIKYIILTFEYKGD